MGKSAFKLPELRHAYSDFTDRTHACDLDCSGDPGVTQQSFQEECDINTIVRRFGIGGELPTGVRTPTYGDFTQVGDFQSAMNALRAAEESFMAMPAEVRTEFDNNPARFVDFCSDSNNFDRMEKLGLVLPEAAARVKAERQAKAEADAQAEFERRLKARSEESQGVPGKGGKAP